MKKRVLFIISIIAFVLSTQVFAQERSPVRIAIIDTGVSTAAISEKNLEEGKNYILTAQSTEDREGHGTSVAAVIVGSESAKIEGICPDAVIVPLVFYSVSEDGKTVRGSTSMMAQMIRQAVDVYKCDIINISSGTSTHADMLDKAVKYAEDKGVLVVSSVGNGGKTTKYYPAACDGALCVGSVNSRGDGASTFSNYHIRLDVLAPGENIQTAKISGEPEIISGTSFSTAYVTGVIAKMMTENPGLSAVEAGRMIIASAKDIGDSGYDEKTGWGVLDVKAAQSFAADGRIFRDVEKGKWYFEAVNKAAQKGIISGTSSVTFSPERETTRAMLWVMLYRMSGKETVESGGVWYENARKWAIEANISDGKSPDAPITREQLAVMLCRYADSLGKETKARAELSSFSDASQISGYATDAMSWANAAGLIGGTSKTTLSPKNNATRAQVAAIFVRFHEQLLQQ